MDFLEFNKKKTNYFINSAASRQKKLKLRKGNKMPINLDNNFWNNAAANAVGTIFATLITGALGFFLFNPLRQWIYKNNPVLARFLLKILDFIFQPVLWIAAFFVFQMMIILNVYRFWNNIVEFRLFELAGLTAKSCAAGAV